MQTAGYFKTKVNYLHVQLSHVTCRDTNSADPCFCPFDSARFVAPSGPVPDLPDIRCHSKPSVLTTLSEFVVCFHCYRFRFSSHINPEVSQNLLSFLTLLCLLFTQFPHSTFLQCSYFAASRNSFSFTSLSTSYYSLLYIVFRHSHAFFIPSALHSTFTAPNFTPLFALSYFSPHFFSVCPIRQLPN
jgi:hypothetical protein